MASDSDTETLPLQGDAAARSGRATRRVVAAAATLVVLSALAYSSTVPRAVRRGAFSASAPLGGTSGTYGWSCKDCSASGSGAFLTWSCDCKDESQTYRGTSTVLQWTCQKGTDVDASDSDTELWNDNGCLQCKAYNDAWDDLKLGYQDLCMAVSPDWIASLFKNQ